MLVIGHPLLNSMNFYEVTSIEQIQNTPANSTMYIEFSAKEIIDFCRENGVKFALHVKNLKEVVFSNILGASYIVLDDSLALDGQKIANEYMFDAKVLVIIDDENEIETYALAGIDGVIFPSAVKSF